jgi:hypothetical protein
MFESDFTGLTAEVTLESEISAGCDGFSNTPSPAHTKPTTLKKAAEIR